MNKAFSLFFAVVALFASVPVSHAQDTANDDRLSGIRASSIRIVRSEFALAHIPIAINPSAVLHQRDTYGGTVGFESALRYALNAFLTDMSGRENPATILYPSMHHDMDPAAGMVTAPQEVVAQLRAYMEMPTAELRLVTGGNGESSDIEVPGSENVRDAWIFTLTLPESVSDHVYYAVVPRDGSAPYIYGFN